MKLFDEPVFSKKKKKEKKITGWNAAKRHILCGARSRVLKSPISPKRYRNEERAGNDFDPRRLLQPDKRKHPCPPLNLHFPQASKNLRTSFFSQKTTLIARPSSAVSHDQKACRSTKYACTYIPRGPSARPVHAAGSLRKWACFLSTSPLRILRIIMNEKKEKKKKKKEKKRKKRGEKTARCRVRRGCKASRARALPTKALVSRGLISNDTFFPCKCRSFIRKIDDGSRILDNPFSPFQTPSLPSASPVSTRADSNGR